MTVLPHPDSPRSPTISPRPISRSTPSTARAVAAPRLHHQWMPDEILAEQGVSPDTVRILEQMGHTVLLGGRTIGRTQSIMIKDGQLLGATDTRRPQGWVAGY